MTNSVLSITPQSTTSVQSATPSPTSKLDDLEFLLSVASSSSKCTKNGNANSGRSSRNSTETRVSLHNDFISLASNQERIGNNKQCNGSSIYSNTTEAQQAQRWPCSSCAIMIGFCHLIFAIILIIFDVATNASTHAIFPVSASLLFFISAVLSFIAAQKLDRIAQTILLFTSIVSIILCILMFIESASQVNDLVSNDYTWSSLPLLLVFNCPDEKNVEMCVRKFSIFHVVIMCIALIELVVFCITIIVCFQSLQNTFIVQNFKSPYSTLIDGDYLKLFVTPELKPPGNYLI